MAKRQAGRLRLIVAAAGYGKTTALRRLFPEPAARWQRGCDIGALAGDGLTEQALLDAVTRVPNTFRWRCPRGGRSAPRLPSG